MVFIKSYGTVISIQLYEKCMYQVYNLYSIDFYLNLKSHPGDKDY